MRLGIPKEIKNGERRVGMTPDGVRELTAHGHEVVVEYAAGEKSGFGDGEYLNAGAELVNADAAWAADMVVKVKEPLPQEYVHLRPGLLLFTFLHLAAVPELARKLVEHEVRAIGYETVELEDGRLPLLAPMSQVAGRVGMMMAAQYLRADLPNGMSGRGMLLGGIPGIPTGMTVVIGAGNVGRQAAHVAIGFDSEVVVLDRSEEHLQRLRHAMPAVRTEIYSDALLRELLPGCDVLIGAALVPGEHAPRLLTESHLQMMPKGSVLVDIAIDQGGMSETSRPTSYNAPLYETAGVLHCCLPNFPACVPRSSTIALQAATLPYIVSLADQGGEAAIRSDAALRRGVNTWEGEVVHAGVAHGLEMPLGELTV